MALPREFHRTDYDEALTSQRCCRRGAPAAMLSSSGLPCRSRWLTRRSEGNAGGNAEEYPSTPHETWPSAVPTAAWSNIRIAPKAQNSRDARWRSVLLRRSINDDRDSDAKTYMRRLFAGNYPPRAVHMSCGVCRCVAAAGRAGMSLLTDVVVLSQIRWHPHHSTLHDLTPSLARHRTRWTASCASVVATRAGARPALPARCSSEHWTGMQAATQRSAKRRPGHPAIDGVPDDVVAGQSAARWHFVQSRANCAPTAALLSA